MYICLNKSLKRLLRNFQTGYFFGIHVIKYMFLYKIHFLFFDKMKKHLQKKKKVKNVSYLLLRQPLQKSRSTHTKKWAVTKGAKRCHLVFDVLLFHVIYSDF